MKKPAKTNTDPTSRRRSRSKPAAHKPFSQEAEESTSPEAVEALDAEIELSEEDVEHLAKDSGSIGVGVETEFGRDDADNFDPGTESGTESEFVEPGTEPELGMAIEKPRALAPTERGLAPRDALRQYMAEVERHSLLNREEEHELAVRYHRTGDVDAAYRLVTANLRLVVKIAHEYHRTAFSLLDLVQEGNVGLMHAVKKFDPYRGVKLSTYAAWWIRAYILRYIMGNWRMVKLGTTQAQRKLFFNLRKEQAKLAAEGFEPTTKLLAERLDVTEQDVTEMDQRLAQDEFSLDVPLSADEPTRATRTDRMVAPTVAADEGLAEHQLKAILREKLSEFGKRLKDKELYIFSNRLTSEEPMTLQEIGDRYGITRERARQIEAKLIRDLKTWIQEVVPDFKELQIGPRDE